MQLHILQPSLYIDISTVFDSILWPHNARHTGSFSDTNATRRHDHQIDPQMVMTNPVMNNHITKRRITEQNSDLAVPTSFKK